jgi:N-acetylmuramoyl-L-alanine amidase
MTATGRAQGAQPAAAPPAQQAAPAKPAAAASRPSAATARPAAGPSRPAAATARHTAPSSPTGPAPIPINRTVIVLDPAHGGVDSGSQISDTTVEKNVTLALAFRLRSLLTARGFSVVMTREEDAAAVPNAAGSPMTLDDRAGIANRADAAACLVLHATRSGNGVHLYRSELEASKAQPFVAPWMTAQAAWIPQSQRLESQMTAAFSRSGLALVASNASVRPIDSMTCPALVVELAPSGDDADSINDTDYQQRVALAIAGELVFWRSQVQPPARLPAPASATVRQAAPSDAAGAQP